jgi:dihydrofolate reductase
MLSAMPPRGPNPHSRQTAAIRQGIMATERGEYRVGLRIFSTVFGSELPSEGEGLSHYGLCLAKVEKKFNQAIKVCQQAIESQFYDSSHYVNLIQVYLAAGTRKKAVDTLEQAMAKMPRDPALLTLRSQMGFRADPIFPMLPRSNPLNKYLGMARYRLRQVYFRHRQNKVLVGVGVFVFFLLWFSGILWFLLSIDN